MHVCPCVWVLLLLVSLAAIGQTPEQAESRFQRADAAIAKLDEQIATAQAKNPPDTGLLTKLRRDRVVALRDRERWKDAVDQADELRKSGDRLPPYVLQAEADSLLALRRPREARSVYQAVIDAEPDNQAALTGRFYSEIETEDFRAAFATIDTLAANEKKLAKSRASPASGDHTEKINEQIAAGLARFYASMDGEAWRRLTNLVQKDPNLGYLRTSMAKVANARGWSRRGAKEAEIGASLSPTDIGSQIALIDSRIWLRQYSDARSKAADLARMYPENAAVQRLVREEGVIRQWDLETDFGSYHELVGSTNPQAPGTGLSTITHIYSPLMADHWRFAGSFLYSNANPIEGFVERYQQGIGLEWRRSFLTVEADGWSNTGTVYRPGATVTVDWKATDHWDFAANADLFSAETPLRALLHGITANEAGVGVGYDWHESRGFAANLHALHFTDTNQRWAGGSRFAQRLVNQPHFNLTARPEVYASANSITTAPYYNPSRDLSLFASADADQIIHRHYEHVWRQRASAGAGTYWEHGFGWAPIATVIYEQSIDFNAITTLRYGVNFSRRVYDAGPVDSVTFSIGLSRRF